MRGTVPRVRLYCHGTYTRAAPRMSPAAAMARLPAPSSDHPNSNASNDTATAAAAMTPEEDISHVKAKRKCHHPARQPIGEIASSSKARKARQRPKRAPVWDQLMEAYSPYQ